MKFNFDKCVVMNFGTSRTKRKYEYKMNSQTLETVKHNPYLGVELTDNLKYHDHIDTITSKASRVLGFVKRNLKHCPRTVKERAYQTLVRPKLEYSSPRARIFHFMAVEESRHEKVCSQIYSILSGFKQVIKVNFILAYSC